VQALTVEEAQERRERLAKMRSLLFAHEQKAKRLKAIKSKGFHRHAKKAAKMKVLSSLAFQGLPFRRSKPAAAAPKLGTSSRF
jgi:U3 small nucleolar RNA-associated protein 14